ncbi:MAG TPA: glycoside hydrolase family 3 N-terminal domain-containing protein [Candidatus Dormibacteraeota bacterium]|nr:glycoside hydrolase family 3 N-terminal domain-containing protein [Candidatus Dormibacteraeota bacterium]
MAPRRFLIQAAIVAVIVLAALPQTLGPAAAHSTVAVRATASPASGQTPMPTPAAAANVSSLPAPAGLSLDMAVGQMMAASFSGPVITDGLRHLILDEKVGTVLIFADNFTDAASLAQLTANLQAIGREAGLPAPLLITVDEEGGRVMRVSDGVAPLPSQLQLGSAGPQAVQDAVAANAAGLHRLGVQLNLAPVADLRTNPADAVIGDRSYGADPATVGPLVAAAVNGMHDGGVAATLKHFPGLGGAAGDPHAAMPTDGVSLDQWAAGRARTFQAGIDAGADAVMTTALIVPGLDPSGTPALFSRTVVTGLLRERLHFQGVIVTDGLGMGGITVLYNLPDATVAAVRAGNDLVLLNSGDAAYEAAAIEAVKQQVRSGSISLDQVQASAARVIALRARWPAWAPSALEAATPTPTVDLAVSLTRP